MDANQLQQLALNAELNHWPPHLGVTTDAEKVAYLAERLREATEYAMDQESLAASRDEDISTLKIKIDDLESDFESQIESLRDDLEKLQEESE